MFLTYLGHQHCPRYSIAVSPFRNNVFNIFRSSALPSGRLEERRQSKHCDLIITRLSNGTNTSHATQHMYVVYLYNISQIAHLIHVQHMTHPTQLADDLHKTFSNWKYIWKYKTTWFGSGPSDAFAQLSAHRISRLARINLKCQGVFFSNPFFNQDLGEQHIWTWHF